MDSTAKEIVGHATKRLLLERPHYGILLSKLHVSEDKRVPTMGTDGLRILYNPSFVESITVSECAAVLAHEALHVALLHPLRENGRDHQRWNIACDLIVNRLLKDDGMYLPDGGFIADNASKCAEELYDELPESQEMPQGGSGEEGEMSIGQDLLQPGQEVDIDEAADKIDGICRQAGLNPEQLPRDMTGLRTQKKGWRGVLSQAVAKVAVRGGPAESTRWSRRHMHRGLYLDQPIGGAGKIGVAIDTSGSMEGPELKTAATELVAISGELKAQLLRIDADTEVGKMVYHDPDEPVENLIGGGGTDFNPAIETAEEMGCDLLIYLTDGYADKPREHSIPVIWGIIHGEDIEVKTEL